jgi:hypothetical protein
MENIKYRDEYYSSQESDESEQVAKDEEGTDVKDINENRFFITRSERTSKPPD